MLPSTLVMLVAGPWAGRLATRANPRLPLVIGTGFGMLAFIFYAFFHSTEWEICVGGVLLGVGIGAHGGQRGKGRAHSRPRRHPGGSRHGSQ
jgi:MFS family permease